MTSVGLLLLTDVSVGLPGPEIGRAETVTCMYAEDFGHIPRLFCAKRMRIDSCVCIYQVCSVVSMCSDQLSQYEWEGRSGYATLWLHYSVRV